MFFATNCTVTVSPGSSAPFGGLQLSLTSVEPFTMKYGVSGTMVKLLGATAKNTLLTASILRRDCVLYRLGSCTVSLPSFAALAASVMGKLNPPLVERRMLTTPALMGEFAVPATSHNTVWLPDQTTL